MRCTLVLIAVFLTGICAPAHADYFADTILVMEQVFLPHHRPSFEEAAVMESILKFAAEQNGKRWNNRLVMKRDSYQNGLVIVPATGRFVGKSDRPIGLQNHVDIVPNLADPKATPDQIRAAYERGSKVEITGDYLHHAGNEKNLGLDNTFGAACALTYLLHPELEHPTLYLYFLRDEEMEMSGAEKTDFEELDRTFTLLNLDSEEGDTFISQTVDGLSAAGNLTFPVSSIPEGYVGIEIVVDGLKGGHMGILAHRKLGNAIVWLPWLISFINQRLGHNPLTEAVVYEVTSHKSGLSQTASIKLAVPKRFLTDKIGSLTGMEQLKVAAQEGLEALKGKPQYAEEAEAKQTVNEITITNAKTGAAFRDVSMVFAKMALLPTSILGTDARYADSIESYGQPYTMSLKPDGQFEVAFLVRSFSMNELKRLTARYTQQMGLFGFGVQTATPMTSIGWKADHNSWLYQVIRERLPEYKFVGARGIIEPGVLGLRKPGIYMASFGPTILDAHKRTERLHIPSGRKFVGDLQKLIFESGLRSLDIPWCSVPISNGGNQ